LLWHCRGLCTPIHPFLAKKTKKTTTFEIGQLQLFNSSFDIHSRRTRVSTCFFSLFLTYSANVAGFLDNFPGIFEIGRLQLDFFEIGHSRSFSKSDILGPPEQARAAIPVSEIGHSCPVSKTDNYVRF